MLQNPSAALPRRRVAGAPETGSRGAGQTVSLLHPLCPASATIPVTQGGALKVQCLKAAHPIAFLSAVFFFLVALYVYTNPVSVMYATKNFSILVCLLSF